MKINTEKCIGCGRCADYCMLKCISKNGNSYQINEEECVDCGVCLRADVCSRNAIYMPEENFQYPRAVRMQFSDPGVQHPSLKAWGRGTEEAKTNDVVAKFRHGEYGLLLEFGRPCTGTRFTEVEKVTTAVRKMGLPILEDNPLYGLLEEDGSGRFKKEFVNEKVLSAILELRMEEKDLETVLPAILELLNDVDTVVSVGLVTRFGENAALPVVDKLASMNIPVRPNAKINVGLGRPLIP